MLLDPKREAFVQAYIETGCQAEALRRANPNALKWTPKTVHEKASRMMAEGKVQARIDAARQETAERMAISRDDIAHMLQKTYDGAFRTAQFSASVAAAMGLAKLLGHIVDKAEHTGKDGTPLMPSINVNITRTVKQA